MPGVLITGSGMVAGGLAAAAADRGMEHSVLSRTDLDVTNAQQAAWQIERLNPGVIFHTAALTRVNHCEEDPALAFEVNAGGTASIVAAAQACGAVVVLFSTDYVFDGSREQGWLEADEPHPLNAYGRSKLAAERVVLEYKKGQVIRTSGVFGRRFDGKQERNFFGAIREQVTSGTGKIPVVSDQYSAVCYAPFLGKMVLEGLDNGLERIEHMVCRGSESWAGWARLATGILGFDPDRIEPVPSKTHFTGAMRPMHSVLKSSSPEVSEMGFRYRAIDGLSEYLSDD